jgi:hypothetical protein
MQRVLFVEVHFITGKLYPLLKWEELCGQLLKNYTIRL